MAVTFTAITKQHCIAKAVCILYEPSVYNGTGQEVRKNLVFPVGQATRDQLEAIETQLQLKDLCSILKPDSIIEVKVDMEQVWLFDSEHIQINPPDKWADRTVDVCLEIKGTWRTATHSGLSVSCTDVRLVNHACHQSNRRPPTPPRSTIIKRTGRVRLEQLVTSRRE